MLTAANLQKVTMQAITEGKIQDTFEIVGKSGLIYTYTESTLKPVRSETLEQYNARISSAPKEIPTLDTVPAKVNELWQILRQKQQALKAIMTEENIVAARKYSVKIAEIKLIVMLEVYKSIKVRMSRKGTDEFAKVRV